MAEAIRAAGSIPSGHLYAMLMDKLELHEYEALLGSLKRTDLVTETSDHMLHWNGIDAQQTSTPNS